MANLTLFEKVYAKLRSEPQNFDMEEYVRDGRFCIGGAAILLSAATTASERVEAAIRQINLVLGL